MELLEEIARIARQFWVVWLMILFIGIVVWAYWPRRRKEMEQHARIPLEDDDKSAGDGGDGKGN